MYIQCCKKFKDIIKKYNLKKKIGRSCNLVEKKTKLHSNLKSSYIGNHL